MSQPQLLTRQLVADGLSAVSIFHQLLADQRYAFLLESVTGGDTRGRYSIIALDPDLIWRCKDGYAEIETKNGITPCDDKPLESLEALIAQHQMDIPEGLPPMLAGLIGMMGYEMVREVEDLPSDKEGPSGLPDGCFMRPQMTLVLDNANDTLTLATPIWNNDTLSEGEARLDAQVAQLQSITPLPPVDSKATTSEVTYDTNMTREGYIQVVETAKEHIRAGEIFQIVPSMRFTAEFPRQPLAFYRALRHLNPSPYMFYLKLDEATIIGASPEILVRSRDGQVTIRPLAGTRKRGATQAEDIALEQELLNDTKEMAEHLMLLDLGRNDAGRVTKGGSVKVTERMTVERYSHVMHIVSNVVGELAEDKNSMQALMAGFPAGTVTGAPKIRAMEILDELEPERRGFYGGCVGYFSTQGEMDSCITLRTALIKDGKLHLQAGAGVVADSNPESEYEEVCNKARALMRAAELTPHFEVNS
ncbi:MAG: anthranilate synthase component I [Rickettsiales bacterium]|nr:anthranilate synthase component I [Rickettsiales bacterium]